MSTRPGRPAVMQSIPMRLAEIKSRVLRACVWLSVCLLVVRSRADLLVLLMSDFLVKDVVSWYGDGRVAGVARDGLLVDQPQAAPAPPLSSPDDHALLPPECHNSSAPQSQIVPGRFASQNNSRDRSNILVQTMT